METMGSDQKLKAYFIDFFETEGLQTIVAAESAPKAKGIAARSIDTAGYMPASKAFKSIRCLRVRGYDSIADKLTECTSPKVAQDLMLRHVADCRGALAKRHPAHVELSASTSEGNGSPEPTRDITDCATDDGIWAVGCGAIAVGIFIAGILFLAWCSR